MGGVVGGVIWNRCGHGSSLTRSELYDTHLDRSTWVEKLRLLASGTLRFVLLIVDRRSLPFVCVLNPTFLVPFGGGLTDSCVGSSLLAPSVG